MNEQQKWVLVGLLVTIIATFIYPPFHFVKGDLTHNMGWGWIFDPPKRGYMDATVNIAFLLVEWVVALLVAGVAYLLAAKGGLPFSTSQVDSAPSTKDRVDSQKRSPNEVPVPRKEKTEPKGVRGWLLLLVLGMMVIGPLLGAVQTSGNLWIAEQEYPEITSLEEWGLYKSWAWLVFLAAAAASFYGGLGLTRGRDKSVVERAKVMLWLRSLEKIS